MLAPHFPDGYQDQRRKRNDQQDQGVGAMQFGHFAVQQRQTHKNKEDMGAEHLERCLAQGQERLHQNQLGEIFPRPVDHARKGEQVQHPQRADLPFIQRQA